MGLGVLLPLPVPLAILAAVDAKMLHVSRIKGADVLVPKRNSLVSVLSDTAHRAFLDDGDRARRVPVLEG